MCMNDTHVYVRPFCRWTGTGNDYHVGTQGALCSALAISTLQLSNTPQPQWGEGCLRVLPAESPLDTAICTGTSLHQMKILGFRLLKWLNLYPIRLQFSPLWMIRRSFARRDGENFSCSNLSARCCGFVDPGWSELKCPSLEEMSLAE